MEKLSTALEILVVDLERAAGRVAEAGQVLSQARC